MSRSLGVTCGAMSQPGTPVWPLFAWTWALLAQAELHGAVLEAPQCGRVAVPNPRL